MTNYLYTHSVNPGKAQCILFPLQPDSDVVIGYFDEDGNGIVQDYYLSGYNSPTLDKVQDLKDAEIQRVDGINTLKFKRSLDTSDSIQDVNLSNEEIHFLLPYSNGKVFSGGFIGKHIETPRVSEIYVLNPENYGSENDNDNIDKLIPDTENIEADNNFITNQISNTQSGILDTVFNTENTEYIFSCTSNSNRRIKSAKVLYEDCPINIGKNFKFSTCNVKRNTNS